VITPFGEIPNGLAARMSLQEQHEWFAARVSRRAVVKGLAVGSGGLVLPALWSPPARATGSTRVSARHLAFGVDPATTMVVDFATEGELVSARVEASSPPGSGVSAEATINAVTGSRRRYGRATLSGLTPGTDYTYRIFLDGQPFSQSHFRTAPAAPEAFRFTAFGDQGTDADARAMLAQVGALRPLFHLLAGDLCYADSSGLGGAGDHFDSAVWDRWMDQNDEVAGALAWMSVPGNHEMEPGFGMHGYAGYLTRVFPGGASPVEIPVATSFRVGSVGFVGLDSNDVSHEIPANRGWTNNAQTAWLERTLKEMRTGDSPVDFVVAFLHHAPYSTNNTHASDGGILGAWVPLFDAYSVDLVISGHNHAYERTLPLREGKVTTSDTTSVNSATATTYITAGGGGASLGNGTVFIPYANKTRVSTADGQQVVEQSWSLPTKTAEHLVLCVDVVPSDAKGGASTMTVRAVDSAGNERDRVLLTRAGVTPRPAVTPPSRPSSDQPSTAAWVAGASASAAVVGGAALALRRRSRPVADPGEDPGKPAAQ